MNRKHQLSVSDLHTEATMNQLFITYRSGASSRYHMLFLKLSRKFALHTWSHATCLVEKSVTLWPHYGWCTRAAFTRSLSDPLSAGDHTLWSRATSARSSRACADASMGVQLRIQTGVQKATWQLRTELAASLRRARLSVGRQVLARRATLGGRCLGGPADLPGLWTTMCKVLPPLRGFHKVEGTDARKASGVISWPR